ncbi:MAG TPA: hypothetical protein VF818_05680 [Ktedonobacterales bacterium]
MKLSVLILSILAIVLIGVGFFISGSQVSSAVAACSQYVNDQTAYQTCLTQHQSSSASGIMGGVGILMLGYITAGVAWLLGLIKTGMTSRWGWFVAIFFLSPISSLIYGIVGPDKKAA